MTHNTTHTPNLHQRLIEHACNTDGWKPNTKDYGWRREMSRMLKDNRWSDEQAEVLEAMSELRSRPDAWRISVRDEDDMLILEFLEIVVWHQISEEKKKDYHRFWWNIDGTDGVRLVIWRMDRFGVVTPFMSEDTVHDMMTVDALLSD